MRAAEAAGCGERACTSGAASEPQKQGSPATVPSFAAAGDAMPSCSQRPAASACSRKHGRSVGEPPLFGSRSVGVPHGSSSSCGSGGHLGGSRRHMGGGRLYGGLLCSLLLILGVLNPSTAAGQSAVDTGAQNGSTPANSTVDPSRLAYETSDGDDLLRPLRTFFPPGTVFGNGTFELGMTIYRILGKDTQRNVDPVTGLDNTFLENVKEAFTQEYQTFNVLTQFGVPTEPNPARVANSSATSPANVAIAAAAKATMDGLMTDPFNEHQQYAAVDIEVTALAGSDLAAQLPSSWLPMAKNTPLFENAMRQRGYVVTALTLESTVSEFAAQTIFPNLSSSNETAISMTLQLIGDIVPLDVPRQTALLYQIQQLLPRLFNGIGPRWSRIDSIRQSVAASTANVTFLMATSSIPEYFEQAMVSALADLPLTLSIAGLPTNVTVTAITPVAGYSLPAQVRAFNNQSLIEEPVNQGVYVPPIRPRTNLSSLAWQGGRLQPGEQVAIGTSRHRVVGAPVVIPVESDDGNAPAASTNPDAPTNITAELKSAFNIMNAAKPWKYALSFGDFGDAATAPRSNMSTNVGTGNGNRRMLRQVPVLSSDFSFNRYNDFAANDFTVFFNGTVGTQLPQAFLPTSLPLNLVTAALRARGYVVNILTLGTSLSQDCVPLLEQIVPQNSTPTTTAIQSEFQLATESEAGSGQGTPVLPFTTEIQTALLALLRNVLPPLSNNLGPRWVRITSYQAGASAMAGVNVTMLMSSAIPIPEFQTLLVGAFKEIPQLLDLSGLPVSMSVNYMRPVTGYTLNAQLRAFRGLPPIEYAVPVTPSEGGGGLSGGAIAGIAIGAAALVAIVAFAGMFMFLRRRRRRSKEAVAAVVLARESSINSVDSKRGVRHPDDTAEQLYRGGTGTNSSGSQQLFREASRHGSPHGTFVLPRSSTSKDQIGQLDAAVQGWDINADNIEICRDANGDPWLLGEGSYGRVYRGLRGGVQDVAVKVLHATDDSQTKAFRKEISILKSISYDRNIVQFYGAVLTDRPMLVLEYMEGGDLRGALNEDPNGELRWYNRGQSIALDIARGLHFLHSHDVMHSDMKARNVLLSKGRETAKISDVGVAKYLNECGTATQTGNYVAWTFAYAAPEILLNQKAGAQADVYSFGVMLWEIVTGIAPVRGGLSDLSVPSDCPKEIAELIQACLSVDPDLRPTAKQCFQIIRASIARADGSEASVPMTFNPSHLSGSSNSLSTLNELPPPSRRPSSDAGTAGTFNTVGSYGDRLPSARRASVRSDDTNGSGNSRLRHGSGVAAELLEDDATAGDGSSDTAAPAAASSQRESLEG